MTHTKIWTILTAVLIASVIPGILTDTAAAQTTSTESIKGTPIVDTTKLAGVVKYVEGNTLVVSMSGGGVRAFNVPDATKFVIDGKRVTVHDLKPGTSLRATIITTTTPVTERTVTNLSGKVFFVSGTSVILTMPDGGNKVYKSLPHYSFTVNGQKTDLSGLRKGMMITAEKIEEVPTTEVATNAVVYGRAPRTVNLAGSRPPQ
jgi:hypothetical protein